MKSLLILLAALPAAYAATPFDGKTTFGASTVLLGQGDATGAGLSATNIFGWDIRLTTNDSKPITFELGDLSWDSGSGVLYYPEDGSPVEFASLSFSANDQSIFTLLGLNISIAGMGDSTGESVVLTGYREGQAVSGASFTQALGISTFDLISLAGNPAFESIDQLVITPAPGSTIGYLSVDNLEATDFRAIPEPSAAILLGGSALLLALHRRR